MAIITKPASIEKNSPATFTLNKSDLVALTIVDQNEHFSDMTNWSKVILNYKSSDRNQFHVVSFDATQTSPTGIFFASEKASDIFEIISINIVDFDNAILRIPSSELTLADFEVDMSSVQPPTQGFLSWTNPAPGVYNIEADGGLTEGPNRGSGTYYTIFDYTHVLTGDFELIFNVGTWTHDSAFGIRTVANPSTFSGSVGYGGGSTNNIHVNDQAQIVGPGLSGKEWKIVRTGSTTNFYTDGVLSHTTTSIVGDVWPVATLIYGGTLISASYSAAQSASPYNPLLISNQITLSNSNYTALSTDSGGYASMGYAQTNTPITLASGKFYKEFTLDAKGLGFVSQYFGIRFFTTEPTDFTPSGSSSPYGLSDNEYQIYIQNGTSLFSQLDQDPTNNSLLSSTQTPNNGDIIGIAIDADDPDKGMYFSINGVFLNNANPATGAGKIAVKTIFPSIPDSIKPFFFTQLMGQNQYTINATPSHLPAGYQAV